MNTNDLRYLNIIRGHIDGPINEAIGESASARYMPGAISTVLARRMAAAELQTPQMEIMMEAIQEMLPFLRLQAAVNPEAAALLSRQELTLVVEGKAGFETLEALITTLSVWLAGRDDKLSQQWCRKLITQGLEHVDALEAVYLDIAARPSVKIENPNSNGLSKEQQVRLVHELRQHAGETESLEIASCTALLGGLCKQTILVDLRHNKNLPDKIVIRADHPDAPQDTTVVAEYPLLQLLYRKGIKVPKPLFLDEKGIVMGHPLMIVSRAAGRTIADGLNFFTPPTPALMDQLAQEMAKIHAISVSDLPSSLSSQNLSNEEQMRNNLYSLRQVWDEFGSDSVVVEAAFKWLFENLHYAGSGQALTHGDFRFNNILVENGNIECILDWEMVSVSSPAFDLGYAYHHVVKAIPWRRFMDIYCQAGGAEISDETLKFYALRADIFALVYLAKLEKGILRGSINKLDLAYAGCHMRQHVLYLLSGRLRTILDGGSF